MKKWGLLLLCLWVVDRFEGEWAVLLAPDPAD